MQLEYWQLLVGTLTGFIVAFLAEPVKTFFTNRARIASLREAIYREITANYLLLHSVKSSRYIPEGHEAYIGSDAGYIARNLHRECYDHILKENPIDFYQLEEAATINIIYFKLSATSKFIYNDRDKDDNSIQFVAMDVLTFVMDELGEPMALANLKANILRKVSPEVYEELRKNRKRYIGNSLITNGNYVSQLLSKVPEGEDPNDYLSPMFSHLIDEVAKGKKPENVLPKIKAVLSSDKHPPIEVPAEKVQDKPAHHY